MTEAQKALQEALTNPEFVQALADADSAEEGLKLLNEKGLELPLDEVEKLMDELNALDEEAVEAVAGGTSGESTNFNITYQETNILVVNNIYNFNVSFNYNKK